MIKIGISLKQKAIIWRMKKQGLPSSIVKYTENVFLNKIQGKYSKAIMQFPKKVIRDINKIIKEAVIATGKTADGLIDSTDFNPSDLPSDRIESLFAEIRTVNYLSSQGFEGISFIKSKRKQKRADIYAKKDGNGYIIEVTCSSSCATSDNWHASAIINYIIRKMEGSQNKRLQLTNTLAAYDASRIVLVVVLDSEDKNALNSSKDALYIARQAWLRIGERKLHICIIMGKPDIVYDIPKGSLLAKIVHKSGYVKGCPILINILHRLIRTFGTFVEVGSGNIVYPPWTS